MRAIRSDKPLKLASPAKLTMQGRALAPQPFLSGTGQPRRATSSSIGARQPQLGQERAAQAPWPALRRGRRQPQHVVRAEPFSERAEPFSETAAQVRRLLDRDRKEMNYEELERSFSSQPDTPASASAADSQPSTSAPAPPPPRPVNPFEASSTAASVAGARGVGCRGGLLPSLVGLAGAVAPSTSLCLLLCCSCCSAPPPAPAAKTPVSPFGPASAGAASPFGTPGLGAASSSRRPFGEPAGLFPGMAPAEIKEEPWWTQITLTQVVIVLSFTTIIGLMVGTFFFVLNVGAIHFNE